MADGVKTAELRKDDRAFAVGDILVLQEWDEQKAKDWYDAWYLAWTGTYSAFNTMRAESEAVKVAYTGRELRRRVTHILRGEPWLASGYVMLSLDVASVEREACAQVADKTKTDLEAADWFDLEKIHPPYVAGAIAAAIRARED